MMNVRSATQPNAQTTRMSAHRILSRISILCALVIAISAASPAARADDEKKDRWNIFKKKEKKQEPAPLAQAPRKAGDKEIWIIECRVCTGPRHAAEAESLATSLRAVPNLNPGAVSILSEKDRSRVIYGSYELKYVRSGGDVVVEQSKQLRDDITYIKHLAAGDTHPFLTARATPQPTDDVGPPEWNLANAKGYYTLHVGVTYPTPELRDHKGAAVEWVRTLRQDGYEAYYYHDPDSAKSDICVGTFGPDAMVTERNGTTHYSEAVLRLQSRGDLRWNLENGHKVWRTTGPMRDKTGKIVSTGGKSANQSFLVKIPGKEDPTPTRRRSR